MSELPDPETFGDYADWPGREVHGPGGRIGSVVEIYLDDATDRPEWVLVELDDGSRFVPLAGGSVQDEAIRVAHGTAAVTGAPDFALTKELSQDQERELYDHYDVAVSEAASESLLPAAEAEAGGEREPTGAAEPEPEPTPVPVSTPAPETGREPEPVATTAPEPEPEPEPESTEPIAALPPEGETSEPDDVGPMIPPRPEPVAPASPPPTTPPPPPPYMEAQETGSRKPAAIIGGVAALAILLLVILRRRD